MSDDAVHMQEPPPVDDEVLTACRALAAAMDAFDQGACESLAVARSDLRAMNLLEHGPLPSATIAHRLGLTRPAVTALVDRLEAAGYVTRTPDPHDRRSRLISLEPRVWQAFARVYRPLGNRIVSTSQALTPSARSRLAAHLDELTTAYVEASHVVRSPHPSP